MLCCHVLTIFYALCLCGIVRCDQFSYSDKNGPENWSKQHPLCNGTFQSPINIDRVKAVEKEFPQLNLYNFNKVPSSTKILNNGHTVVVFMTYDENNIPSVSGGPLEKIFNGYQLEQFHFHWGLNDSVGSESQVNGVSYPAEMHLVLRNPSYESIEDALGMENGVAVMAFFLEVDEFSSEAFEEMASELGQIIKIENSVDLPNPRPLKEYIPEELGSFFTYPGSLTTPPCSENVDWMVFTNSIKIARQELSAFRALAFMETSLKNNFRPIQALNNRVVYKNLEKNSSVRRTWNSLVAILLGLVVLYNNTKVFMAIQPNRTKIKAAVEEEQTMSIGLHAAV